MRVIWIGGLAHFFRSAEALKAFSIEVVRFERPSAVPRSTLASASAVIVESDAQPSGDEPGWEQASRLLRLPLVLFWTSPTFGSVHLKAILRSRTPDGIVVSGLNDSAISFYQELLSAARRAISAGLAGSLRERFHRLPSSARYALNALICQPSEVHNVNDLARRSLMSRRSLDRGYHAVGLSPRRVIRGARVGIAIDRIREGRTLYEVLSGSGIADKQQFRIYLRQIFRDVRISQLSSLPIDSTIERLTTSCTACQQSAGLDMDE